MACGVPGGLEPAHYAKLRPGFEGPAALLAALLVVAAPASAGRTRLEPGPLPAPAQDVSFDHDHARWSAVLERCLRDGRIDYETLGRERGELDQYLLDLRAVGREEFAGWAREQRFAYWINAHNAFTVHLVLSRYPIESVRDIGTTQAPVREQAFVPLGHLNGAGTTDLLSLDTIVQGILRPEFRDARMHAVLHLAALGGPPAAPEALRAGALDAQLEARALAWLSDPARQRYDASERRAELSAVLDWHAQDFVRDAGSLASWIARHGPESACWMADGEVELRFLEFDWSLDDVPREGR